MIIFDCNEINFERRQNAQLRQENIGIVATTNDLVCPLKLLHKLKKSMILTPLRTSLSFVGLMDA